ncbi:hypothetical protein T484DRAFT_1858226 [Baffinella frigidus]|nr:hypothetical protein T484DRAFT_1858226 [Cryptophyta sp. CCMP2293]
MEENDGVILQLESRLAVAGGDRVAQLREALQAMTSELEQLREAMQAMTSELEQVSSPPPP